MSGVPAHINTGQDDGELNVLEREELEINITSSIMTFMSYSINSSSVFVEHSGRTIITTDDIKRAMMVEVFMYFDRPDLKVKVGEWRNIILDEMKNNTSENEETGDDSENEETGNDSENEETGDDKIEVEEKDKKTCSCGVCDLMNTIKDKWQYYNPTDEMGKILKKHIDCME